MKRAFALGVLAILWTGVSHAFTLVQQPTNYVIGATTVSLSVPNVAAHDSLVVMVTGTGGATVSTFTDSTGTVVQEVAYAGVSNGALAIYYEADTGATAQTHTLSLTMSTTGQYRITAAEYSGLGTTSTLDVASAVATGTGVTAASASVPPAASGELAIGVISTGSNYPTITGNSVSVRSLQARLEADLHG